MKQLPFIYLTVPKILFTDVILIFTGFKVDSVLKSGWTGLLYAASYANAEVTSLLLDNGANPNFRKGTFILHG